MVDLIRGVITRGTVKLERTPRTDFPAWDTIFKTAFDEHMRQWAVLDYLLPFILYHREGCLVEIGVGHSTFFMCKHAHEYDRIVYSCDINTKKLTKLFDGHETRLMPSEDFIKSFDDTPAVVLIDGDHTYKTAKMEFDFFYGKLVEGGVIFLHDTYPFDEELVSNIGCGDVYRLRQELEKRRNEMDVFTWPYGGMWCGLTMIMKKEKDRPYWGK